MTEHLDAESIARLPKAEFGFPGPERDRLVVLILSGAKTATAALLMDYAEDDEPLPHVGGRSILVDSANRPVAVLETTEVETVPLGSVTDRQAVDEGEGDVTVEQWRRTHESFWNSGEYRDWFADPDFVVDDGSMVVLEHFTVAERLR
ncbi:ASCH domain-containing protein [Bifidobacterium platyrrhinorum]|uniref:ASCH domain-containing protein n=1 Tax=Bifidobacterium platyrrhinorum TaxID=2661628 RepID=A0A6L9SQ73_9BIFI|nr:ASCH domain-containing protein [Bifidobacterium platyrrhinorum]NEG54668.1 ASCH domain-containing protein [Bifidobacterium platyrrhinorum]